jgi:hypothetical protein
VTRCCECGDETSGSCTTTIDSHRNGPDLAGPENLSQMKVNKSGDVYQSKETNIYFANGLGIQARLIRT